MGPEEKHYRLALSLIPGIGCTWLKKLLVHFGSAKAIFEAANSRNSYLPQKIAQHISANSRLAQAKTILQLHEQEGIQLITTEEDDYPQRLIELPDNPPILYYKGKAALNQRRVVSIIGTRQLTSYGQTSITKFLEQLLPYQPLIVSGLAYGADIWAHKQALALGLATVAVLPTSLNKIYPTMHTKIAIQMCMLGGGLLSEYPIDSGLKAYSFVARNRIIAGLSDVTIIIEAKEKSGALITAYYANNYHREVFALPGNIYAATSAGCHQLIKRNQAHLLTHINDLAYIMNWTEPTKKLPKKDIYATYQLTPSEEMILKQLQQAAEPIAIDTLSATTALPSGELQAALLSLELQGILRALPGKCFTLTPMHNA
ncbi:DNA-processing protein DprA [Candidatus Cardinium hertigii]|uniref:DNA-protecting protein DprA n=1 Tax=Candidatus Cardinium hertigii TaxID=247481 RepID=A0A3N2QBU9_9BACT|nr:DNA-processing protein DprA [Candidatus Cardinium hertigii]ROT47294.1 DNA-protecting protein DprA [Candidatus Cardinium hertigii]ROT47494.1 DNA-protecting protein DprA [Candidatus Cardinium hertigii]